MGDVRNCGRFKDVDDMHGQGASYVIPAGTGDARSVTNRAHRQSIWMQSQGNCSSEKILAWSRVGASRDFQQEFLREQLSEIRSSSVLEVFFDFYVYTTDETASTREYTTG